MRDKCLTKISIYPAVSELFETAYKLKQKYKKI